MSQYNLFGSNNLETEIPEAIMDLILDLNEGNGENSLLKVRSENCCEDPTKLLSFHPLTPPESVETPKVSSSSVAEDNRVALPAPELLPNLVSSPQQAPSSSGPIRSARKRAERTRFTTEQLSILVGRYKASKYLNRFEIFDLSKQIGVDEKIVKTWFQNQRVKERKMAKVPPKSREQLQPTPLTPMPAYSPSYGFPQLTPPPPQFFQNNQRFFDQQQAYNWVHGQAQQAESFEQYYPWEPRQFQAPGSYNQYYNGNLN
ncbi:hypothetical protein DMENIID0001_096280 [Sergentomyia squamirostris]